MEKITKCTNSGFEGLSVCWEAVLKFHLIVTFVTKRLTIDISGLTSKLRMYPSSSYLCFDNPTKP